MIFITEIMSKSTFTVKELKNKCKELKIKGYSKKSIKKKSDLIELIENFVNKQNTHISENVDKNNGIKFKDIDCFDKSKKTQNESFNKKREKIIEAIINKKIPEQFYKDSLEWLNLKNEIELYLKKFCKMKNITNIQNIKCILKGGRNNHFDIKLITNSKEFNIEFKFNASCVNETPQFVSIIKPSRYLNQNFALWFYINCLWKIAEFGNLIMPQKKIYLKTIHSNKVECMKEFKDKYKNDKKFREYCKKIDKEGIREFIENTEINISKLSEYLLESQKNKHYMCYSNGKIYYDKLNDDIFTLTKLVKKEKTNYIYETKSGMKLEIKLRFKNGCGLIFPAFQIRRKIPTVKELRQICSNECIQAPRLKKDIITILDQKNIIY